MLLWIYSHCLYSLHLFRRILGIITEDSIAFIAPYQNLALTTTTTTAEAVLSCCPDLCKSLLCFLSVSGGTPDSASDLLLPKFRKIHFVKTSRLRRRSSDIWLAYRAGCRYCRRHCISMGLHQSIQVKSRGVLIDLTSNSWGVNNWWLQLHKLMKAVRLETMFDLHFIFFLI